jgi:hypothetical protein
LIASYVGTSPTHDLLFYPRHIPSKTLKSPM